MSAGSPTLTGNTRGILLMVGAMAVFALADVFIKLASVTMSPAHTTLLLLGGGGLVFAAIARVEGHSLRNPHAFAPALLLRYLSEIMGSFGIVISLALVPLSTVGAIIQAAPLTVTVGAVLFLGERVGWRQWAAVCVGFAGVLLIVQPGAEGFSLAILWPVLAMLGLSGRDLTTRRIPADLPSTVLAAYTMLATMPPAILWCLIAEGQLFPDPIQWGYTAGMVTCGALAYLMLIAAIRGTELSVVAPFRYSRLVFLMLLGTLVFGERPGPLVLLGAALIVVSGIYTMWRRGT